MDAIGGAVGGAFGAIGDVAGGVASGIGQAAGAIGQAAGPVLGAIGKAAGPAFLDAVKGQAQSSSGIGNPLSPLKAGYDQIDDLQKLKVNNETKVPQYRIETFNSDEDGTYNPNGKNKSKYRILDDGTMVFLGVTGFSDTRKEADRLNRQYERTSQQKEISSYRNSLAKGLDDYRSSNSINTAEAKNLNSQAIKLEDKTRLLNSNQTELNTFQNKLSELNGLINTLESQNKLGPVNGRLTNAINTLDPSDPLVAKFESIKSSLTVDVAKKLQKLGVLSQSDFNIVNKMIPQLSGSANYNKEIINTLSKNISQRTDENNEDIRQNRALIESWRSFSGSKVPANLGTNPNLGQALRGVPSKGGQIDPSRLNAKDLEYFNWSKANPNDPESKRFLSGIRKEQGL
jgi:hypothetical protein